MREIVLDTETTGFDYNGNDRIIEIGCVELVDRVFTGRSFRRYVNPCRSVPYASTRIHGITDRDLVGAPEFESIAGELMDFLSNDILVIHNALFDCSFLNAEFSRIGFPHIKNDRVIDTIVLARNKYPGSKLSLDALCKRFGISLSNRKVHGALKDAELLSKVYVMMTVPSQVSWFDDKANIKNENRRSSKSYKKRSFPLSQEVDNLHREFVRKNVVSAIWDE